MFLFIVKLTVNSHMNFENSKVPAGGRTHDFMLEKRLTFRLRHNQHTTDDMESVFFLKVP